MSLKQPAQPVVTASCFVLSRRPGMETSEPARRPKWLLNHWLGSHGILSIAIYSLRIQINLLITQRSTCLHFQRSMLSKPNAPCMKQ